MAFTVCALASSNQISPHQLSYLVRSFIKRLLLIAAGFHNFVIFHNLQMPKFFTTSGHAVRYFGAVLLNLSPDFSFSVDDSLREIMSLLHILLD